MTDSARPRRTIADFDPVPLRVRTDGWTPERQREFIRLLHVRRNVGKAAQAVGMSRRSAYRLRERPGAESFAAAWDSAFAPPPASGHEQRSQVGTAPFRQDRPIVRRGEQSSLSPADNASALSFWSVRAQGARTPGEGVPDRRRSADERSN